MMPGSTGDAGVFTILTLTPVSDVDVNVSVNIVNQALESFLFLYIITKNESKTNNFNIA